MIASDVEEVIASDVEEVTASDVEDEESDSEVQAKGKSRLRKKRSYEDCGASDGKDDKSNSSLPQAKTLKKNSSEVASEKVNSDSEEGRKQRSRKWLCTLLTTFCRKGYQLNTHAGKKCRLSYLHRV